MTAPSTFISSGIEWLGEIPAHWQLLPARACFEERDERNSEQQRTEYLSLVAGIGVIPYADKGDVGNKKSDDLSKCKLVEEDDFLINSMNFQIGSFGRSALAGVCSSVYVVLKVKPNFDPSYLMRLFQISGFQKQVQSFGTGILEHRMAFGWDELKFQRIPVPTIEDQRAIAEFLDRETAKIDKIIAKQERLIELLNEKRQGVISHAVTKGLDPAVPMKDSGIWWMGSVPQQWTVCALGQVSKITTGSTPDRDKPEYWNGGIPWIKTGEINYGLIKESEETISELGLANSAAKLAKMGTLLMAMYGQGVTRGRVAILGIDATFNQACAAISPRGHVSTQFLRYFFMAAYPYVRDDGNETSQMNLSSSYISKIRITVPSQQEQVRIVEFLDHEVEVFNTLMGKAKLAIELMKERRAALISAAVTGKIDVSTPTKISIEVGV